MMVNASSIVLGSLMGIILLSGAVLSSSLASAGTDSTDEITITVPTSCSMSSTGNTSHTAEIGNGQSNSTIGETTITTYCNDNEGFAIYAIGYTGDTLGNNKLTSTSLGSTHDIVTGTATSGNTSNWAMKLSTITSPTPSFPIVIAGSTDDNDKEQGDLDYSTFQAVPDDYTKVAYRTSSTDVGTNAEGSILKTTYQAYISPTQTAGTYQGKVKYVMVHPYMQDDSNKPTTALIMQNVSQWGSNVAAGQEVTAIDSRDGKSYTVARLADGNLWMTQNLDHDIKNDGTVTYDNTTTDLGWNTSTNSYDTASWLPVASTHASNDTEWRNYHEDTNPDGGDHQHAESYNPGNLYWNGEINSDYGDSSNYISNSGDSHYHLGNYYNWTAAVAMNDGSAYGVWNGQTYQYDNLKVNQSICPKGWTLPRAGGDENAFKTLWDEYGFDESSYIDGDGEFNIDSALWMNPLYFVASGFHDNNSMYSVVGSLGDFWSSVASSEDDAFYATLFTTADGEIHPNNYDSRSFGLSIRCIARPVSN